MFLLGDTLTQAEHLVCIILGKLLGNHMVNLYIHKRCVSIILSSELEANILQRRRKLAVEAAVHTAVIEWRK